MPAPRQVHGFAIRLLSLAMIVIGVLLIVRTVLAGGSGLALGVILGVLFVAAGGARIYLQERGGRER